MTCPVCARDYPADLVRTVAVGPESFRACPLCALSAVNRAHGLPADTPFAGAGARELHRRAALHLRSSGQETPA